MLSHQNLINIKQFLVLKILCVNTITSINLGFLIKMRGRTTSYDKWLRRYAISKKSQFFEKNKSFYSLPVLKEWA